MFLCYNADRNAKGGVSHKDGADRLTIEPDGRLRFTGGFPDADSILSWVLTFGEKTELLKPEELWNQLRDLIEGLAQYYRRN